MTVRHLRTFVAVCECQSVTGAAARLYMAQPAVSLAIKELEEEYGVRLFERLSRKMFITSDGERLLSYAAHIVSLFDEMDASIRNPDRAGVVRVGCSITIGTCLMPGYVRSFQALKPGVQVRVAVDSSDVISQKVLSGAVDFGLIEGVPAAALSARRFLEDDLTAVCAKDHSLGREVELSEFLSHPLLLRERGSGTRELFEGVVAARGLALEPMWESTSTEALIQAVACGNGVSVLPRRLVSEAVSAGRLREVRLSGLSLARWFSIIYHKNKFLSDTLRAFFKMMR